MLNVVWFKRDLRVYDHRPLTTAAGQGRVLPLYVVEPELWQQPDASARQWLFVAESLKELREDLASLGQPLIVRTGNIIPILKGIRTRFGAFHLWSHEETGNGWTYSRDKSVAGWANESGVDWTEFQHSGVIRRLKSRNGWAKRWHKFMSETLVHPPHLEPMEDIKLGNIPDAIELGLNENVCPGRQTGGRAAGLATLNSFLSERGAPYRRAMSSPSAGAVHCSRLSPYFAWGCVSVREVSQKTWSRQRELKANNIKGGWRGSMSSFTGRLHWRDHFMQKLEDQPNIEFQNFHPSYNGLRPATPESDVFKSWSIGETGLPFVDACMRSLTATGWLNFRMRAMLVAVSSYHLWMDWRKPGEHLARLFTDYEPGIHWSQMQMQSGTTGINTIRIYNPVKQGYDQDESGAFVRKWVPELADVPNEFIHEPWRWENAGNTLGKNYPFPIIDHLAAAKKARQKVWAVRKEYGFRETASDIQNKHGSRKAGVKNRGKRNRKKIASPQLSLPLDEKRNS